jgi:hypothetical protein
MNLMLDKFFLLTITLSFVISCTMSRKEKPIERPSEIKSFQYGSEKIKGKKCIQHRLSKKAYRLGETYIKIGHVKCSNERYFSQIAISTNGKKSWTHIGPYVEGSNAESIIPVAKHSAFLLVSHVMEGPGPEKLFKTVNSGKSWKYVSTIPKGQSHTNQVKKICFTSPNNGFVSVLNFVNDKTKYLKTNDGGVTFLPVPKSSFKCN